MWPFLFAARTLAISRQNPKVLRGDAKMSRADISQIVGKTKIFGRSNRWLAGYYRRLSAVSSEDFQQPPFRSVVTSGRTRMEAKG
jgi:hypothetical protein